MPPFLTVDKLAGMFRPLTPAEAAQAAPLLEVVSAWIRDVKPGIPDDDPAAITVCFDVLRGALQFGKYRGLTQFSETVAHRTRSGGIDTSAVGRFIDPYHRQLLGLSAVGGPVYHFPENDY